MSPTSGALSIPHCQWLAAWIVAAVVCSAVMAAELLRGRGFGQAVIAGVSLAIAAIPEEFSMVYALYLALGAWRLAGERALVRRLPGVETLGFIWEIPPAVWEKTLAINIHGVIHGVRAFAPRMLAAGKPAWIANTSSVGGLGMMPVQAAYILSKHAVLSFSECLRLEMLVKKAPITVSAILPGPVATRIS